MASHVHLFTGPMCAGKTSALYRSICTHVCVATEQRALLLVPITSKAELLHSRNGDIFCGETRFLPDDKLYDVLSETDWELWNTHSVIAVDEVQFLNDSDERLALLCAKAKTDKKHLLLAGLDMDYLQNRFRSTATLQAEAIHITLLKADCGVCGEKETAEFTRLDTNKVTTTKEAYTPVCRTCI